MIRAPSAAKQLLVATPINSFRVRHRKKQSSQGARLMNWSSPKQCGCKTEIRLDACPVNSRVKTRNNNTHLGKNLNSVQVL